jgi:hypothetical protein
MVAAITRRAALEHWWDALPRIGPATLWRSTLGVFVRAEFSLALEKQRQREEQLRQSERSAAIVQKASGMKRLFAFDEEKAAKVLRALPALPAAPQLIASAAAADDVDDETDGYDATVAARIPYLTITRGSAHQPWYTAILQANQAVPAMTPGAEVALLCQTVR